MDFMMQGMNNRASESEKPLRDDLSQLSHLTGDERPRFVEMTSPRPRGYSVVEWGPEFWFSYSFLGCFLLASFEARTLE